MNIKFSSLRSMLGLLVLSTTLAHAADIDLYSNNTANSGVPNVLFVLDNAAGFSASAGNCTYSDGTSPSLNGTAGGIEQCALYNVVNSLPAGAVNIGLMAYNANNISDINNQNCGGSNGGCLMVPLTLMSGTAKTNFLSWVKSWRTTGSAGAGYVKANGEATGAAMQEAWAYYAGKTGLSGRNYSGVAPTAGCQKNFVIFIGNAFGANGKPGDGGSTSVQGSLAAAPGVTSSQLTTITIPSGTYGSSAFSCVGNYSMPPHNDSSGLYSDEWARYMYQTDIYSTYQDNQGITTYSVGLLGSDCRPDYPALLSSMAKVGGGKYYATSSYTEIAEAILAILNEVQAVNSVFSSASLPVSVNAQGTYLNQIFLGMFRPDAQANPRWLGNLKQYKFILEYQDPNNPDPNTATLVLGDSNGNAAISSAGTGFISSNAVSFWTTKDTSNLPDSAGGFFKNDSRGAGGAYDSPDGELVDKGGAAQVLRRTNLTSDFTGAVSTSNPRKLYTYCPSGSGCVGNLTDSANAFVTSNTGIAANAFGAGTTVKINSIVRTGTSALVTTNGAHGFTTGTTVTISNASPNDYNVTQSVTVNSSTTFTITGLNDYPSSPSTLNYTAASLGGASVAIQSISRSSSSTSTSDTETATVTTTAAHGFTGTPTVSISGATPSEFNGNKTIAVTGPTSFTYPVTLDPRRTALGTYAVSISAGSYPSQSLTLSKVSGKIRGVTVAAHGFHLGQTVVITSASGNYDSTCQVADVSATTFTCGNIAGNPATETGSVVPDTSAKAISTLQRTGSAVTSTATATLAAGFANWFGTASGNTKVVNITRTSGAGTSEANFVVSNVTITCQNTGCTSFTYPVTVSPILEASGSMTATLAGASPVTIPAGAITRSGTTATVSGVANTFTNGQTVVIDASSPAASGQSAYSGTWQIACAASCSTAFTFGPVTLSPTTPATGANMQAYSGGVSPDKTSLIKWGRGHDNFGDEAGPGGSVTVRPSVHGDVLHSRPVVVNYGDDRGLVVFYGANDGVFRAVNGSQTSAIGTVPAGGELWGLVLPEHYGQLNRQRVNSPELKLPNTFLTSAKPKDYFVDGSPGLYQKLCAGTETSGNCAGKAANSIGQAILYLTMRRGGQFMYAIDVSDPVTPTVLWRVDSSDVYSELGQTWSRPRVTLVRGYANPVIIFGAGYDLAEDAEPPGTDTVGRGIFVLDALTGKLVWRVAPGVSTDCVSTNTNMAMAADGVTMVGACAQETGMKWAIPSDLSFVDRDNDGKIERIYAPDLGGNLWRVDLEPTAGIAPTHWKVTRLAALGCDAGECASGTAPRKFFYPPNVVSVGATGASGSYDMVLIGSGDREHPLKLTDASGTVLAGTSFAVTNRFYGIKDVVTGKDAGTPTPITESSLYNATSVTTSSNYSTATGSNNGFYVTFPDTGEKAVNTSVTVRGTTYFGTNTPTPPAADSCQSNLGKAKGYSLNPFTGLRDVNVFDGGGLPPSPTTGVVNITLSNGSTIKKEFCVGCGGGDGSGNGSGSGGASGAGSCNSALENCSSTKTVPKNLKRTYWYKQ